MFIDRLEQEIKVSHRKKQKFALIFIDLDNFKKINDTQGHVYGDALLIEAGKRITHCIREVDTVGRLGGDEFIILMEDVSTPEIVSNFAQKILATFSDYFLLEDNEYHISASMGITLYPEDGDTPEALIKNADTAMYRSKAKGGNSFSFYDPQLQTLLDRKIELETEILKAIENEEFCAYFQPQVSTTGKIVGAEALIRWIHPIKGIISPCEFIPVAEQFGLIQRLQNVVLRDICKLLNSLNANLIDEDFKVSINISPSQFKSSSLKTELLNIIRHFNVSPTKITLEIIESMLAHDVEHTVQQMEELKSEGFTFSIDDFGTGYSCLTYLHAYPVKELKIDKSFIDRISDQESGLSIVKTIINLARNLKIEVIAEGVETEEQLNILKRCNIDSIQGYFFAKPMPMNEYIKWHKGF